MDTKHICPTCGKTLADNAPEGLCPECLLKAGLGTGVDPGADTGNDKAAFNPPSVAELAPLFPQLEIFELIGKGGMGAVYKARQKELDRIVALKILPPGIGKDPAFAERFTREAKALAMLNHPGIVTIYDFGRADGLFYFLMEFVDGVNLRQLLSAGRISSREALAIVPQICDALQFAHDLGIVHRDIKPDNILLDRRGRVKVADFGLAKLVGMVNEPVSGASPATGSPTPTDPGKIMGTPSYMAPEQKEKPGEVDNRADIYALGVVFYQMLTGELPGKIIEAPSKKVQIDVRLDEVVLRALEKKPELRYQQVSVLKTQVETIAQTPPPVGAAPGATSFTQAALARDYSLNISQCLGRGWNLVITDFWRVVGTSALIWLLTSLATSSLIGILIRYPLIGGLWLYYLDRVRGNRSTAGTAFAGFKVAFLQLVLLGVVVKILLLLGFICLILPGIYLWVVWTFAVPLVADKGLDFWPAMELSRKMVSKHWWKFLWFHLVLALIYLAGVMFCYVGIFIAMPLCAAALAYAYEDIFGSVPPVAGNVPAAAPVTPVPAGGNGGKALAIVAGVVAAVIFLAFLGFLAAIVIPHFVQGRRQAQEWREHLKSMHNSTASVLVVRKNVVLPKKLPPEDIQAILTNGLVAYYPFHGNACDESGNGHDGCLAGNATFGVDQFGRSNGCLSLPGTRGTESGVDIPSLDDLPYRPVTYSVWFWLDDYQPVPPNSDAVMVLVGREQCANLTDGAVCVYSEIGTHTANQLLYFTGQTAYATPLVPPTRKWCQAVFTINRRGRANFYFNGTRVAGHGNAPDGPPLDFRIGASSAGGGDWGPRYAWNGRIDDVRIYNHALSAAEVSGLYQYESVCRGPSHFEISVPAQPKKTYPQPTLVPFRDGTQEATNKAIDPNSSN